MPSRTGARLRQKLSTKERDLLRDGFYARTREQELKCPDLELNVLQSIADVTARVNAAVKPDLTPAQAFAARRAVLAEIEKESLQSKDRLDRQTPFNFVSTADTIGGNSGSPVLNRAGELVGINFDRPRHGLVRNFVYTDAQARHISVHSRGVLEALRTIYGAAPLVAELTRGR